MSNSIAQRLTDALRQRVGQGSDRVRVDGDDVVVHVDVEASERYAVGIRGVEVSPTQPVPDVRDAAERIVHGVTALNDPFQIVEVESREGRAVVRSAEPESDESGVSYWEADVRADGASLRRYRKDHAAPDREVVAEPLPHAVAGKVTEQIVEALTNDQGA